METTKILKCERQVRNKYSLRPGPAKPQIQTDNDIIVILGRWRHVDLLRNKCHQSLTVHSPEGSTQQLRS